MKHTQFSRLICMMMALILCVGMLPATALADNPVAYWAPIKGETEIPLNGFNDVQEKASLGGYIRLNGPLTVPSPLRIGSIVTLDLNGQLVFRCDGWGGEYLIKDNGDYKSRNSGEVILVPKGAVLTIMDSDPYEMHPGKLVSPDRKADNGNQLWRLGNGSNLLYGGIITGGAGYNCAGGIQIDGGKVVLLAGTIAGNISVSGGGGVQITNDGTLEMYGGSIYGNTAVKGLTGGKNGGGVDVENGHFILHGGELGRNFAAGNGGAVYVNKTVDRSIYLDGTVSGDWADEKSYPIRFTDNKAQKGGAIFVNNTKVAQISGAYFNSNQSVSDGGAVYVDTGDGVTISGCLLTYNTAGGNSKSGSGGALYLNKKGVTVNNSLITHNRAEWNGGGVYNNSTNSMSGTTITDNLCVQQGSGVYDNSKLSISGLMVIKNNAGDNLHTGANSNLGASGMDAASEVWITVPSESRHGGAILSRSATNARPEVFHIDARSGSGLYVAYGNDPADTAKFRKLYVTTTQPGAVSWSEVSLNPNGKADPAHPLVDNVTPNGYHNEYTNSDYDLQRGYYRFESTDNAGGYSEGLAVYYYSDGMFAQNPVIYSEQLATMTLALTTTAATMPDEHGNAVEDYTNRFGFLLQTLSDLGFADEDIQINDWYTKRPTENSLGVAVAAKKLAVGPGLSTAGEAPLYLVPVMIRGSGYEKEWMSNVTISEGNYGTTDRNWDESAGFAQSADIALSELNRYLESHPEVAKAVAEGRVKFWIGGHSRGAAVSNILAKRLTDLYCNYSGSGDTTAEPTIDGSAWTYTYPAAGDIRTVSGHMFGDAAQHNQVYAFTAGTPQGGTPQRRHIAGYTCYGGYFNIHNSIDAADAVVYTAPSAMGFIRYGVDHYVPGYYSVPDKGKVEKGGIGGIKIGNNVVEGPYGVRVDQDTLTRYGLTQYADNYPLTKSNDGVYDKNAYLPIRAEAVRQLAAVAPNNVLEDYWHGGTISPLAGTLKLYDYVNETSFHHDDLRTANVFLPNFLDMVVTYTASALGAGYWGYNGVQWWDKRFNAAAMYTGTDRKPYNLTSTDVHDALRRAFSTASVSEGNHTSLDTYSVFRSVTLDGSYWKKGSGMTIQNAAKALMAVTLGGNGEERAKVPRIMAQKLHTLTSSAFSLYRDLVGNVYSMSQEKYDQYIKQLADLILGEPSAGERSRGYMSLKEAIGSENYQTVVEAWPVLCAMVLDLENDDYYYNGYDYLGTLVFNAGTFAVAHASDFTIAWLRSYDRLYNGSTAMPKHSDDMAPHRLTDLQGKPINVSAQVTYDKANPTVFDPKGEKTVAFAYTPAAPAVASVAYRIDDDVYQAAFETGAEITVSAAGVDSVVVRLKNDARQPGGAIYYTIDSVKSDGVDADTMLPLKAKTLYNAGTGLTLPAAADGRALEYTIRYICTAYRADSPIQNLTLRIVPADPPTPEPTLLVAVEQVCDVTVEYGEKPALPESVTAAARDGMLLSLPITWTPGAGGTYRGTVDISDFMLDPGTALPGYTQSGGTLTAEIEVMVLPRPQLSMPTAYPQPGSYSSAQTVTLSTAESGASILYRIGTSGDFAAYTGPIPLEIPASGEKEYVIEAQVAGASYEDSDVAVFRYALSPATYTLTAQTGGTEETFTCFAGDTVLLVPETPEGKLFKQWVVRDSDSNIIGTSKDSSFTCTMPAQNIRAAAEFIDVAEATGVAVYMDTPSAYFLASDAVVEVLGGSETLDFCAPGILWSSTGSGKYTATLNVPADKAYRFKDGFSAGDCSVYSFIGNQPDENARTVSAVKNPDGSLTVVIEFTGTGSGELKACTVTLELLDVGGTSLGDPVEITALANTEVYLTAPAEEGKEFLAWEEKDGRFLGSTDTLRFLLGDENVALNAVYLPAVSTVALTVDKPEAGKPFSAALSAVSLTAGGKTYALPEALLSEFTLTWFDAESLMEPTRDYAAYGTAYLLGIDLPRQIAMDAGGRELVLRLSEDTECTVNGENQHLYDDGLYDPFLLVKFDKTAEDAYALFEGSVWDLTYADDEALRKVLPGYEAGGMIDRSVPELLLCEHLEKQGAEDAVVFYLGMRSVNAEGIGFVEDGDPVYTETQYRDARTFLETYPADADVQFYAAKMHLSGENAGTIVPVSVQATDGALSLEVGERALYVIGWTENNSSGGYSGGGSSGTTTYTAEVKDAEHGKITVDPKAAAEGAKVTVTVTPDEGYEVDAVTVRDADGKDVPVTKNADGTYSYTQPKGKVTVTATFKEKAKENSDGLTEEALLAKFTDLDPKGWYLDDVRYCVENGMMNGVADGKFDPNGTTTRAMIVTILYRLEGEPVIRSGMSFDDVTESDWYAKAVSWAESQGIVTGYGDGRFGPNDPITREQLAAILYRYAQHKGEGFKGLWSFKLDFPDAGDVSDWATEAMSWMVMNDVINGMDGRLNPQGDATRVQVAAMVHRFCELIKK